jgi:hypothetical protein
MIDADKIEPVRRFRSRRQKAVRSSRGDLSAFSDLVAFGRSPLVSHPPKGNLGYRLSVGL